MTTNNQNNKVSGLCDANSAINIGNKVKPHSFLNFSTGIAVDVHRFADINSPDSFPLQLAGLTWENTPRLLGHSDGDVAAHSICDALLGAARLGDIGQMFGVDKPEVAGISGAEMLSQVASRLAKAGWLIGNVCCQIIGSRPKICSRHKEAELAISQSLAANLTTNASESYPAVMVNLSATTTDRLGFLGCGGQLNNGEGLAAISNVLIYFNKTEK